MKEATFWLFNAAALATMYFVPSFPAVGVAVLAACAMLCLLSFLQNTHEPGNPAYGLLGSLLLFSGAYALLAYPNASTSGLSGYLAEGSVWLGCGLWIFWVFRVSWRKREATNAQATDQSDNISVGD